MESEPEETAEPTEEPSAEETPEPETGAEAPSDGNADESGSVTQTGQSDSADQTDEANQAGTAGGSEAVADVGYTINAMESTMYAKSAVNVRNQPSTDGEKVGRLSYGQQVTITGQCEETGWFQIELNGETAFVSNSYIVAEKPATTTTKTASGSQGSGSGSSQASNQETTNSETAAKTDSTTEEAQLCNSEFVALLNADRQAMGLSTVSANGTLDSNALTSAKNLVSNYSHDALSRGGANRENIGQGYSSVADIYAAWKASPGHWAAMTDAGLKYCSVAKCGTNWVFLGYAEDVLSNKYTDESGNVDIEAAVNDGEMREIGTTTDENTGNSATTYGSEGTMTTEEAIENGTITEEENENLDDIFANW
ncbi:MAG: SH3 domain-containing protein [Lachnospiraceae bacterium]|nr:SH3 domain-containing protein [Lachnospiraceae bacterium]